MNVAHSRLPIRSCGLLASLLLASALGCTGPGTQQTEKGIELTHEQTLDWVRQHRAWRMARKTKPIHARPVEAEEVGKEFQTADRAVERARAGYWLCVGVAGEPWFQTKERIDKRYTSSRHETKRFTFDSQPRDYQVFKPKGNVRNWAAQVKGTWKGRTITGFIIRASYDKEHPLASPAGGYVVRDYIPDPYADRDADVWLVQEALFESTYELLPLGGATSEHGS
jgi:hypothetical protein